MGADLYIRKLTDEVEKPWDSEDGYFRDSYNGTSVLWTLGLSWWQDVTPLLNEEGELGGKNLKKFRDMVLNAKQEMPTESKLKEMYCKIDAEETLESWHNYYTDKREKLLAFLNRAIELNSSIDASL
jgi:hypothetical protein